MGVEYSFLDLNAWIGTAQEYAELFGGETASEDTATETMYETYTVSVGTNSYINLRESPNTTSAVLAKYANGAKVNISTISDGWGKLYGQAGYMSIDWLEKA